MRLALLLGFFLLLIPFAEAKVFSYQNQTVAGYIRGGGGLSRLGQDAFIHSSGNATQFTDEDVQYNFSGELGAQFSMGAVNMRLGVEALRPKELEMKGTNASNAELFTLTSSVFVFSPMVTFEYVYSSGPSARFYGYAGLGYSMVTLDNHYEMTAAGTAAFTLQSYTEKGDATAYSTVAGMGFETLFVDNVAFAMDLGYRYLVVNGLKHKGSYSTIAQGAVNKGDKVENANGTDRSLDLSGITVNASFKFFVNL